MEIYHGINVYLIDFAKTPYMYNAILSYGLVP